MTAAAKKIFEQALMLPEDERERLAEALIATLRREPPGDVERAWDDEVARRIEAAERGDDVALDWDEVCRQLRAKYERA